MKNYKKGFTLVELLAVLTVLAIIALITVPTIVKVQEKAREDSRIVSIKEYGRLVEQAVLKWSVENKGKTSFPPYLSTYEIESDGEDISCDENMEITSNGDISLFNCYFVNSDDDDKYNYIKGKVNKVE